MKRQTTSLRSFRYSEYSILGYSEYSVLGYSEYSVLGYSKYSVLEYHKLEENLSFVSELQYSKIPKTIKYANFCVYLCSSFCPMDT